MKKIYSLTGLIVLILLASCKSATKLYQKGNYDEAVQVAVKKLQKDPNDAKLKSLIQDAYQYAVTDHETRINTYSQSNDETKWEWMYNEYADLQRLHDAIFKSPAAFEVVKPTDYSSQLITNGEKAGDVHYQRGMDWMNNNDKQSFRKAYREFQAAASFKPGDGNIKQMLDQSYDMATTRVLVMPADGRDFRFSSYTSFSNFDNDIIRDLQNRSVSEFVRFYSNWDAQRLNLVPDEIMEIHFTQFNIGRVNDSYATREISKEVVVKETVYKPDSVIKQYQTVKAKITTTKRNMYSEGDLNISVRDNTGRWLWNDNVHGSHGWSTEFSSFTGDERAMSQEDKNLVNKVRETPPSEDEMMRCIKEEIYGTFMTKVRNYYSRYY